MPGRMPLALLLLPALAAVPFGCGSRKATPAGPGPAAAAPADRAGSPGPGDPAAPGEAVYTVFLPVDPGLVPESGYADALVATLRFRKRGESLDVGLKVKESRIHVYSRQGIRSACEEGGFEKKEEILEEGMPRPPEKMERPFVFDAATGQGSAGVDQACARLAKEIRARGCEALLEIEASRDVPAGLVLEGYRRGCEQAGVVGAVFAGAGNPLEEEAPPVSTIWKEDVELVLRVDESLLRDAADGCPVMRVTEASGKLQVDLPFAWKAPETDPEEEEGGPSGLSRVSAVLREFASREKDPKDPRISNGWLEVRVPAETPYGVLQAAMQAACSAGVGIRKLRFVLSGKPAFQAGR